MRFESPEVGGVKLVKTYTFKRGDYVIDVRNEIVNASGAPVSPRLYLQLVRDGNAAAGRHQLLFDLHRSGDRHGTKFQKIEFKAIEKRGRRREGRPHDRSGAAAGSRWCSTTSPSAWLIDKPTARLAGEYFTGKSDVINPATGQRPTCIRSA